MDDYFNETLKQILYAFEKILNAVKNESLKSIEWIANQEIKAIKNDLSLLEGDKK